MSSNKTKIPGTVWTWTKIFGTFTGQKCFETRFPETKMPVLDRSLLKASWNLNNHTLESWFCKHNENHRFRLRFKTPVLKENIGVFWHWFLDFNFRIECFTHFILYLNFQTQLGKKCRNSYHELANFWQLATLGT